jgi:hypothetical protein
MKNQHLKIKITFLLSLLTISVATKILGNNPPDEGMWLPILIDRLNYVDMQKMGLHLTADELYNINHSCLKDDIVGLSGGTATNGFFCTAEVVSGQGLLFTNHHCGFNAVQSHSTTDHDYLTNGFWAFSKNEELPNENMSASFLVRMENITDSVIPFLSDTLKENSRAEKIKDLTSKMKKRASEDGKYEVSIKPFYGGNEYYLFVFKTYQDVRLVGAPPSSVGKFGGDTDNWMWPRHTGDFTIFRIYADSAGNPAAYSTKNIPLQATTYLPISLKGIKKNDFAMIWGYPGTTTRYLTSYGIEFNLNTFYPLIINIYGKKLEVMKTRMDVDKAVKIAYSAKYATLANTWKNYIGQTQMLRKNKVEEKKKSIENNFVEWYSKDPVLKKKYGAVLGNLENGYKALNSVSVPYFYASIGGLGLDIAKLSIQFGGLKTALEKNNKTAIKEAADGLKEKVKEHFQAEDTFISKGILAELLKIYSLNVPENQLPFVFELIRTKYNNDFSAFSDEVFSNSFLATESAAKAFLEKPRLSIIKKDLGWNMVQSFKDATGKFKTAYGSARAETGAGNRRYIAGLMEMNPKQVEYPDANSTLRMSYGTVLDYFPADAVHYNYYTTLKGVMEKEDSTNDEFIVDKKLKDLYSKQDYGPYGDNGEMVTCFLTNNDITGGNSGSPVINADGELIGLAFDGNWEAMSSDICFEPALERCINVDIRYVLFIIDKYAGATNLIKELKLVK